MRVTHGLATIAASLALLTLGLAEPVRAGGFRDGVRDALGPRFDAAPELRAAPAAATAATRRGCA